MSILINGEPIEFGNLEQIKFLRKENRTKESRDLDSEETSVGYLTSEPDHQCDCPHCDGADYEITAEFDCYYCKHKQSIHVSTIRETRNEEKALKDCDKDEIHCIKCGGVHIYLQDFEGIFPMYYNIEVKPIFNPNQLILELNESKEV